MATSMLLIADTHVPTRARDLPPELWDAVDGADVVVHAGDWVEAGLLERLRERASVLHGVYGNNDGPELRAALPEVARWELEGLRFAAIHETGLGGRPRGENGCGVPPTPTCWCSATATSRGTP